MSAGDVIHHRRFNQPLYFERCTFGTISPTDFDAVYEFRNKVFVAIEVKHKNAPEPNGQKLAYERFVEAVSHKPGVTAVAFYCEHEVPADRPVMLHSVRAKMVYTDIGSGSFRWFSYPEKPFVVLKINDLLDRCGLDCSLRCEEVA